MKPLSGEREIDRARSFDHNVIDQILALDLAAEHSNDHGSPTSRARPQQHLRKNARMITRDQRMLEEVDYWRKRAGWYDDDGSMTDYNSGVYNSYYSIDDDSYSDSSSSSSGSSSSSSGRSFTDYFNLGNYFNSSSMMTVAQIIGGLVGLAVIVMLIRAISRRSSKRSSRSDRKSSSGRRKRSSSRRRSGSRSRSKSRARSRSRRRSEGNVDTDYELMDDKSAYSSRSKRSSRSRSKRRHENELV